MIGVKIVVDCLHTKKDLGMPVSKSFCCSKVDITDLQNSPEV
jgi:hypothetical protein